MMIFHFIWPAGLFFHVVGEGVVRLLKNGRQHISDRENYIDFRMRLLGEPGTYVRVLAHLYLFQLYESCVSTFMYETLFSLRNLLIICVA